MLILPHSKKSTKCYSIGDMQRQDWLMFIGTFLFGMVSGIYLYFTGFEPTFRAPEQRNDLDVIGFRITAEEFGPCREQVRGCASWRLEGNRAYRFIRTDAAGTILDSREGLISRNLYNPLEEALNLWFQGRSDIQYDATPSTCPDLGSWYRYRVEIRERPVFHMHSCDPALVGDPIFTSLRNITSTFPQ